MSYECAQHCMRLCLDHASLASVLEDAAGINDRARLQGQGLLRQGSAHDGQECRQHLQPTPRAVEHKTGAAGGRSSQHMQGATTTAVPQQEWPCLHTSPIGLRGYTLPLAMSVRVSASRSTSTSWPAAPAAVNSPAMGARQATRTRHWCSTCGEQTWPGSWSRLVWWAARTVHALTCLQSLAQAFLSLDRVDLATAAAGDPCDAKQQARPGQL